MAVVDEAAGGVVEGEAVADDMVCGALGGGVATAAEFEAVAVALEVGEAPAVETVAVGEGVFDRDGGFEFPVVMAMVSHVVEAVDGLMGKEVGNHVGQGIDSPKVEAVINVVPKPCTNEHVTLSRSFLAGETIRTLAVLSRIPVAVRI